MNGKRERRKPEFFLLNQTLCSFDKCQPQLVSSEYNLFMSVLYQFELELEIMN